MKKTYSQLIQQLFNVNFFGGVKLGLQNSLRIQQELHFPDTAYKCIHVTGTNGKGSVTTKIARACEKEGYRVGLYTSPHISCFRERIQINGKYIEEEDIEAILPELFQIMEAKQINATFFEITTMLALEYFKRQKVEIAVLETGLGGRLDATNVINPILSVITSIDLDHTEILGNTIEEIAFEKAGIIKPSVPVVIGNKVPYSVIKQVAEKINSPIHQVKINKFLNFDEENVSIAKEALLQLSRFINLTNTSISQGLKERPPCRFELSFYNDCPILLDVAHNPDGLKRLFQAVKEKFGSKRLRILFGLSSSKDWKSCLHIIKEHAEDFHLVEANNGRGVPVEKLEEHLRLLGVQDEHLFIDNCIRKSVDHAIQEAKRRNQLLIIGGTFFIMNEVREAIGIKEPRDLFDMNERYTQGK